MRELVFVHGRSQEKKDLTALKAEWVTAWQTGLRKSGLEMPLPEQNIRFPYYGQTLYDMLAGVPEDKVAEIVVRGDLGGDAEKQFVKEIVDEIVDKASVTEAQLEAVAGREVVERGPQNWEWVQGMLRVIDKHLPGGSGLSIALFTNDVYQYPRNPGIRDPIESGVRKAMTPGVESILVGHSLGSVVAYNLLRREGEANKWKVPLFITVGSPLAVTAIFRSLKPVGHPKCAARWYNAMDERDVVALYPLDKDHFDIDPAVENKTDVKNDTRNRHGISGYLSDKDVARRIYDALIQ